MAKLPASALWHNIPEELKALPQWLLGRADKTGALKIPTSITAGGKFCAGSSTDPKTWLTFEAAVEAARKHNYSIGFVLCKDDPFCVIDLDVKNVFNEADKEKWTDQETLDRYERLVGAFNSYSERSLSGHGTHIWIIANIGLGARRDGVEVYSQERFIVCTGRIIEHLPIADQQDMINSFVAEMHRDQISPLALVDNLQTEEDEVILERAANASNGDKFMGLWNSTCSEEIPGTNTKQLGTFAEYGYESQSEADYALMSMLTFYSKSNDQCKRLFRMSGLGKRAKATKNDRYLKTTLEWIRSREAMESTAQANVKINLSNQVKKAIAF